MAAAIVSLTTSSTPSSVSNSSTTNNLKSNILDNKLLNMEQYGLNKIIKNNYPVYNTDLNNNNNTDNFNTRIIFNIDDLVWAKSNNHPWWPCKIVKDDLNLFFKKIGDKLMYHVEFIGLYKERAWLFDINLFKYDGIESFKTYAQNQVDRANSKSAKEELAERFQLKVALNRREQWHKAVQHADILNKTSTKRKRDQNESVTNYREKFIKNENETHKSFGNFNNHQLLNNENLSDEDDDTFKSESYLGKNENQTYFNNEENHSSLNNEFDSSLTNSTTTITGLINEQVSLNKKKRGRKPKSPTQITQCPDNELKFKIKFNSLDKPTNSKKNKKQKNRSRSTSRSSSNSSRSSSNSSSSSNSTSSRSSSSSSSSCSSSNSSDSASSSSSSNNSVNNKNNKSVIKKQLNSIGASSWSNSSEYDQNSPSLVLNTQNFNYSDIEKINLKKLNARKPSSSFSISTPTDSPISVTTPTKKKSTQQSTSNKTTNRRRSSKSLSENNEINNSLLFDENNLLNSAQNFNESFINSNGGNSTPETYLIDRYKYAVRHIKQGLSVEEACNKYRISKGALLKCLSGGTAPRGKKTRLTESEENEIVEWLINYKDLKYNDAIHLVFEQVAQKFEQAQRPNPFHNGKPSMDWWYDFLSRHPQIMASKPDWLMRGKVNDQYIRDVQSGHLKCTKFRRALLSAIQYIRSLNDGNAVSLSEPSTPNSSNQSLNLPSSSSFPSTSSALSNSSKSKSSTKSNSQAKENSGLKQNSKQITSNSNNSNINVNNTNNNNNSKLTTSSSMNSLQISNKNKLLNSNQIKQEPEQNMFFNSQQNKIKSRPSNNNFSNNIGTNSQALYNNNQLMIENTKLNNYQERSNISNMMHGNNLNNSNGSSSTTTNTTSSTGLNIDFNEEDLSSVSPISLINSKLSNNTDQIFNINSNRLNKNDLFSTQNILNGKIENLSDNEEIEEDENEEEDEENLNNQNDDDLNANVTFHTEIFNSELDENNFEDLIDPNELIDKISHHHHHQQHNNQNHHHIHHNNQQHHHNHHQHHNHHHHHNHHQQLHFDDQASYNTSSMYNINHHKSDNENPNQYLFNTNEYYLNHDQQKPQNTLLFHNHILNVPTTSTTTNYDQIFSQAHHHQHNHQHQNLHQNHNRNQQNHLLVQDDEDENEDGLINNDDEDDLMRNTIDPSAFLP